MRVRVCVSEHILIMREANQKYAVQLRQAGRGFKISHG